MRVISICIYKDGFALKKLHFFIAGGRWGLKGLYFRYGITVNDKDRLA